MSTLVHSLRRLSPAGSAGFPQGSQRGISQRGLAVAGMVALVSVIPGGWGLALDALSEAYLSVTVFVAGTLALVFGAERAFKADLGAWLQRHRRWQVPAATLLGAFPGCGGAIIAVTQYTRGYLSFGAVVATLTATMGDAMFLLLAREPHTAVGVLLVSMLVGVVSGYVIDAIHGQGFMRPRARSGDRNQCPLNSATEKNATRMHGMQGLWLGLMVPGVVLGVLAAFQVDTASGMPQWFGESPVYWLGVVGSVLALAMWAGQGEEEKDCNAGCESNTTSLTREVIVNTNFVSAWVIFAFVGFEVLITLSGVELAEGLQVWAPLVPAMAVMVGLIPGCGPQIMVTSLYLSGAVPFSAQLGNALANDGDALFPALAVAPKAAMLATVYSAIPAMLMAYAWYGFVELV